MKRFIGLIAVLFLLFVFTSCGNSEYQIAYKNTDGGLELSASGIYEKESLEIPAKYEGTRIVKIAKKAYDNCPNLKHVTIYLEGDLEIASNAFSGLKLESLSFIGNGKVVFDNEDNFEDTTIKNLYLKEGAYLYFDLDYVDSSPNIKQIENIYIDNGHITVGEYYYYYLCPTNLYINNKAIIDRNMAYLTPDNTYISSDVTSLNIDLKTKHLYLENDFNFTNDMQISCSHSYGFLWVNTRYDNVAYNYHIPLSVNYFPSYLFGNQLADGDSNFTVNYSATASMFNMIETGREQNDNFFNHNYYLHDISEQTFKVEFIVDGQLYHEDELLYDSTVSLPNEPTKEGLLFKGWFTDLEGENSFANDTRITGYLKLYGLFYSEEEMNQVDLDLAGWGFVLSDGIYTQTLGSNVSEYSFQSALLGIGAKVKVTKHNGVIVDNPSPSIELVYGQNLLTVVASSYNNKTIKEYEVNIYRIASYRINYYDGEELYQSIFVDETSKPENLAISKPGYTFMYWVDETGNKFDFNENASKNQNLYAKWEKIYYDITFRNDYSTEKPSNISIGYLDMVLWPTLTEQVDYYQFIGFDAVINGERYTLWRVGEDSNRYQFTQNIEAIAIFKLIDYPIIYHDLSQTELIKITHKSYNIESEFDLEEVDRPGYRFTCWYYNDNTIDKISKKQFSGPIDLYPRFEIINYSINYKDVKDNDIELVIDYNIESPAFDLPILEATNYNFKGWKINNQIVNKFDPKQYEPKNYDLYAAWEAISYSITYTNTLDVAIINMPRSYTVEDEFNLREIYKEGYQFLGWYLDDVKIDKIEKGTSGNLILEAKWQLEGVTFITNAEEFLNIANDPDGKYYLEEDINLKGAILTPINSFNGILDGCGHKVNNFVINGSGYVYGFINNNKGTIKDITFEDLTITVNSTCRGGGNYYFGLIADNSGTIENVTMQNGTIKMTVNMINTANNGNGENFAALGGLVGLNQGTIKNCINNIDLTISTILANRTTYDNPTSDTQVKVFIAGGLAGRNTGTILDSSSKSNIQVTTSVEAIGQHNGVTNWHTALTYGYVRLGGFAGSNGGLIKNGYHIGDVTSTVGYRSVQYWDRDNPIYQAYVGGFIGQSTNGSVEACYNSGNISARCFADGHSYDDARVGGFIGANQYGNSSIKSCYQTGSVTLNKAGTMGGGFAGINEGAIQESYATGNISISDGKGAGFLYENAASGSILKCLDMVDVSINNTNAKRFGFSNSGSFYENYYISTQSISLNGQNYTAKELNVDSVSANQIYTDEFIYDKLYWEKEIWRTLSDNAPILVFEIETIHEFIRKEIKPTCDNMGIIYFECADCGKKYISEFTSPLGHQFTYKSTFSDCYEEGYDIYQCEVCGQIEHRNFTEPLNHSDRQLIRTIFPTCESGGFSIYSCNICGNQFQDDFVDHLPHLSSEIIERVEATCQEEGYLIFHCNRCSKDIRMTIEKIEHTPIYVPRLNPTCGIEYDEYGHKTINPASGYTEGYRCSVCGITLEGIEEIKPHNFILIETQKEPDCENAGSGLYRCKTCEFESLLAIDKLGHNDANKDFICDVCGKLVFAKSGISFDEFEAINSAEELANIKMDGKYYLAKDIELPNNWVSLGTRDNPFNGILYGNGYSIKNLIYDNFTNTAGIFGYNSGTLVDIIIDTIKFRMQFTEGAGGEVVFGALAAHNSGNIISVSVKGQVDISLLLRLDIDDRSSHTLNGTYVVGLIAGYNSGMIASSEVSSNINLNCNNSSEVSTSAGFANLTNKPKTTTNMSVFYGTICGRNTNEIVSCIQSGNIKVTTFTFSDTLIDLSGGTAISNSNFYIATFVGVNEGAITNLEANNIASYQKNKSQDVSDLFHETKATSNHYQDDIYGNKIALNRGEING